MFTRAIQRAVLSMVLLSICAIEATAQIVMPTQQHETLDVELHSLRDKVTLYMGDPQEFLRLIVRPEDVEPRVEYASQAQAVLRIRDLYLYQEPPPDLENMSDKEKEKYLPNRQTWEIRLSPSGPTKFVLNCEQGEGEFDFTDFQVQDVYVQGEETKVDVEFSRPNPIVLETFRANVSNGSLRFRRVINARAREIVLYVPESSCNVEITGKEFEGESAITFQGVPTEMRLLVSRKIGLRVGGPATTTARFQAKHMTHDGDEWLSQGYDNAKYRARIIFVEEIPGLVVSWE